MDRSYGDGAALWDCTNIFACKDTELRLREAAAPVLHPGVPRALRENPGLRHAPGRPLGEHFQPATGGQGMTAVCLVGPAIIWDCCPCGSISDLLEHCKAGNAYGKPSLHPNIDTEYGEHRAKSTK